MRFFALLAVATHLFAQADRLSTAHLAAVHEQRVQWMKVRAPAAPSPGVYRDFRAVFHSFSDGSSGAVVNAAKAADVQVVILRGDPVPKPNWTGLRDGILLIAGDAPPRDDLPPAAKDPKERTRLIAAEKEYPDEAFAAATGALPFSLAPWTAASQPISGIAGENAPGSLAVAFRHVSTHILARQLTEADIRASLAAGRSYISHDWLCDPTGFSFIVENNYGLYELGDHPALSGLGAGRIGMHASLPVPAKLKLFRDGAVVAEASGAKFAYTPTEPGAYRLEAWLTADGEEHPWILTNPIYVIQSSMLSLPSSALAPDVEVRRDITYIEGAPADAAKHKLDLYLPRDKKHFPVLMFVHGGSWRSGDRSLYTALGNRFAKVGIGVAIPSYRLMPRNPHPAQIEDTAAAFAWVYKNIAQYGGDANRLYLAGHSAGGHLVSLLALDDTYLRKLGVPMSAIKGVASISGVYDVSKIAAFPAGAGDSPSPIAHVHPQAPPFLVGYCQWDYLALPLQAREFTAALKKSFDSVQLLYVPEQGHISEIIHVVQDDDAIAQAILKLIQ